MRETGAVILSTALNIASTEKRPAMCHLLFFRFGRFAYRCASAFVEKFYFTARHRPNIGQTIKLAAHLQDHLAVYDLASMFTTGRVISVRSATNDGGAYWAKKSTASALQYLRSRIGILPNVPRADRVISSIDANIFAMSRSLPFESIAMIVLPFGS